MAASSFWSGAGGPLASAAIGLAGLPFQIAGKRLEMQTMAGGLEAQLRAQNAALETNAMRDRENMYAQMSEGLGARNFGPIAADLEYGRQLEAEKARRRFTDQDIGYASELSRRERSAAISPERQQALRFENLLAMKREQARAEAPMAAMFGRKAPTNVSSMVV